MDSDDDLLEFAEEPELLAARRGVERFWRVLIVDDEPDVHVTTKLALAEAEVLGRRIEFLDAYSASEGREILARERDIAVILLDVVMESTDSGLLLVETIRRELGLKEVRIILRTGQPGYAPEIDAVRDFDINDYKTKGDLTRNKLFASLTAAIRSFQQIIALDASRRGLELILQASSRLMATQGIQDFAAGVITQLAALLQVAPEGLVCAQTRQSDDDARWRPCVIAGAGHYRELIDQPLDHLDDARIREALAECFAQRRSLVGIETTVLFFGSATGQDMAVFLDLTEPLDEINQRLIEVFCTNIAACYDNVRLFNQLSASAYVDGLCGLPNRVALAALIEQAREEPGVDAKALVLVDIDRFSELNQAFGHVYGDKVLKAFAARLVESFGDRAALARIGGDTFGLLGAEAAIGPEAVTRAMALPLKIDGRDLVVQGTIGVVRMADAESAAGIDALKDATIALQLAKTERRGSHCYFSADMLAGIRERVRLLDALRRAFESEGLALMYQPQLELASGRVVGCEALLRWRLDDDRFVPPDQFIPLAERSGLIVALGEWVLRTACRDAARLAKDGLRLRMAVNLSVAQLRSPCFSEMLDAALADSGIDPTQLELEITESMAMQSGDEVAERIAQIKQRGIAVAIDDFGTGFSSLAYLEQMDVDRLKIDKTFVARLNAQNAPDSIAATVTQLAKRMGLAVIAEGVETAEQCAWLQAMGVDEVQGWHFARAMPATELVGWVSRQAH